MYESRTSLVLPVGPAAFPALSAKARLGWGALLQPVRMFLQTPLEGHKPRSQRLMQSELSLAVAGRCRTWSTLLFFPYILHWQMTNVVCFLLQKRSLQTYLNIFCSQIASRLAHMLWYVVKVITLCAGRKGSSDLCKSASSCLPQLTPKWERLMIEFEVT